MNEKYTLMYTTLIREAANVLNDVAAKFEEDELPESFRYFLIDELEGMAYQIEDKEYE